MWLYPLPSIVALCGWLFVFATSGKAVLLSGVGVLLSGIAVFFVRQALTGASPRAAEADRP